MKSSPLDSYNLSEIIGKKIAQVFELKVKRDTVNACFGKKSYSGFTKVIETILNECYLEIDFKGDIQPYYKAWIFAMGVGEDPGTNFVDYVNWIKDKQRNYKIYVLHRNEFDKIEMNAPFNAEHFQKWLFEHVKYKE